MKKIGALLVGVGIVLAVVAVFYARGETALRAEQSLEAEMKSMSLARMKAGLRPADVIVVRSAPGVVLGLLVVLAGLIIVAIPRPRLQVPCPYCAERMNVAAVHCPHCRSDL